MTKEQYELAQSVQDELYKLNKMLYGNGDAKVIEINSINITQHIDGEDYNISMSFDISKELSDTIVEAIKSRIEKLENQFKNICL